MNHHREFQYNFCKQVSFENKQVYKQVFINRILYKTRTHICGITVDRILLLHNTLYSENLHSTFMKMETIFFLLIILMAALQCDSQGVHSSRPERNMFIHKRGPHGRIVLPIHRRLSHKNIRTRQEMEPFNTNIINGGNNQGNKGDNNTNIVTGMYRRILNNDQIHNNYRLHELAINDDNGYYDQLKVLNGPVNNRGQNIQGNEGDGNSFVNSGNHDNIES